jgi:hypothetical protein
MKVLIVISAFIWGSVFLIVIVYFTALFIAHDGNPDFLSIDSCLDAGGKWNCTTRACEH